MSNEKQFNSKYVESYFCQLHTNGIYSLTFNTTERWIPFHAYNDEMYTFGPEEDTETQEGWESRIQTVPEFLPEIKDGTYIRATQQSKDQITWYFIPFYFRDIGTEQTIFHVDNKL